jgi:hypothetical protein
MNPEIMRLYEEIEKYIIHGQYGWELKENAPKDVQEKFNKMMALEDDEIIVKDINEFISGE